MYTSTESVLNKNSGIRDAKKGQEQVADVKHSELLYP